MHRAIRDALQDAAGYRAKGILASLILEATTPVDVDESLLYRAIYTIFRALPERLVPGTTLNIATMDVPDGVELVWEAKERLPADAGEPGSRSFLCAGPHGDLLDIAILALERFCHVRAGHVETHRERVGSSSSFERPAHLVRRVTAFIPTGGSHPGDPAPIREATSLAVPDAPAPSAGPAAQGGWLRRARIVTPALS